jgi:hypothetical protein
VPGATFAIAVIGTNRAGEQVTLERANAILPRHSPVKEIGARLVTYTPFVCPPGAMCPLIVPTGPPPFGVAESPRPLDLPPGRHALAQLHFQFATCWSPTFRRPGALFSRAAIAYRTQGGAVIHQQVRLRDSTPQLKGGASRPTCP